LATKLNLSGAYKLSKIGPARIDTFVPQDTGNHGTLSRAVSTYQVIRMGRPDLLPEIGNPIPNWLDEAGDALDWVRTSGGKAGKPTGNTNCVVTVYGDFEYKTKPAFCKSCMSAARATA